MQGSERLIRKRRHDKEITHKLHLLQEPPNSSQISYHTPVNLNPNANDIRITIPRSDDVFTDLYKAVLIIILSVVNHMKQIWTLISTTWPSTMRTTVTAQNEQHSNRIY